eukprot:762955-Hanusia_phi.AAC.1
MHGTKALTIDGRPLKHLHPCDPFKYLGMRISLWRRGNETPNRCMFTWGEKEHLFKKTKEMTEQIRGAAYDAAQRHWLVNVAVLSVFRYSACLVGWTMNDLQNFDSLWTAAFRAAWNLPKSCAGAMFHLPVSSGGLQVKHPMTCLAKEALAFLQRESKEEGAIRDEILHQFKAWKTEWGCATLEELGKECSERWNQPNQCIQGPEKLAIWIANKLRTRVRWKRIDDEQEGIMGRLHRMEGGDRAGLPPRRWSSLAAFWRTLPLMGITRANQVEEGEGLGLTLPSKACPFQHRREEIEDSIYRMTGETVRWRLEGRGVKRREVDKDEANNEQTPPERRKRKLGQGRARQGKTKRTKKFEIAEGKSWDKKNSKIIKWLQEWNTMESETGEDEYHTFSTADHSPGGDEVTWRRTKEGLAVVSRNTARTAKEDRETMAVSLTTTPYRMVDAREETEDEGTNRTVLLGQWEEIRKNARDQEEAWTHLQEAIRQAESTETQPLSWEAIHCILGQAKLQGIRGVATLHKCPARKETTSNEQTQIAGWQGRHTDTIAEQEEKDIRWWIGWKSEIESRPIPPGFLIHGSIPKGTRIAYTRNFWKTGQRRLVKTEQDLI